MENANARIVRFSQPRRQRPPFILFQRVKRIKGGAVVLPTWHVRFSIRGALGRSVQVRKSLGTEDHARAAELAWKVYARVTGSTGPRPEAIAASIQSRIDVHAGDPLIGPLFAEYHTHLKARAAQATARERWYVLRRFFKSLGADWQTTRLSEVTTLAISRYIDRMRLERGVTAWTAYDIRKSLSAFFSYAVLHHEFPRNPAKGVLLPRRPQRSIDYLAHGQIRPFLGLLRREAPILHGPVATAILAGLRRSEIIWLTWEDVNLDLRIIHIRFKTIGGQEYAPKTNKTRIVPISRELLRILKALPRRATWVFPSPMGMRWQSNNLGNRLRAFVRAHGLKHGFLTFRHTFGSQLAQKGLSLYKIAELMGNSEEVCREHYAALRPHEMQEEVSFL